MILVGGATLVGCNAIIGLELGEPDGAPASSAGGVTSSAVSTSSSSSASSGGGGQTSSTQSSSSAGGAAGGAGGAGGLGGAGGATSSSSGPPATIDCDMEDCPLGGVNACCWDQHEIHEPPRGQCVGSDPDDCNTAANDTGAESRITCQRPDHCPGGICCAKRKTFQFAQFYYSDVTCQDACQYGQNERVLCDMADPICPIVTVDGEPTQLVCTDSDLLPEGYWVCSAP